MKDYMTKKFIKQYALPLMSLAVVCTVVAVKADVDVSGIFEGLTNAVKNFAPIKRAELQYQGYSRAAKLIISSVGIGFIAGVLQAISSLTAPRLSYLTLLLYLLALGTWGAGVYFALAL